MTTSPYPFFVHQMLCELKNPTTTENKRKQLRARIAMNIGDKQALRTLLGLNPKEFDAFYADMLPAELTTEDTIDTFLSTYGKTEADNLPDPLHFPTTPSNYAALIDQESTEMTAMSPSELLASVNTPAATPIETQQDASSPVKPKESEPSASTQTLSESLAAAMIKSKNYTKALEIITELSLKNPEKSVYFADQIRFLRKLIYLQNH